MDIQDQSLSYANNAIGGLLKKMIKGFDHYNISADQLVVISTIYKVVTDFKKYVVNGSIRVDIKQIESEGNFKFQEILIGADGLRLTNGGYVTGENGGDSYSDVVFPIEDEDEAMETVQIVDTFISEFLDKLESQNKEIDTEDSGDGIIKNEDLEEEA